MKRLYFLLAFLLSVTAGTAQELRIGDMLPDVVVAKTVPGITSAIQTDTYKDKLLIIDLWATNCSSCIAAMPRLDSLQRRFESQIKILPVTAEPESMVSLFWKKNRNTRNLKLFTGVGDTALQKHFPHKSVSHEVWIYKGKVIAITAVDYVTPDNIQKVLDGKTVDLPLKDDFGGRFDGAVQSIKDTNTIGGNSATAIVKYAMMSKYKPGIKPGAIMNENRGGISRNTAERSVRAYFINQPVYTAYLWALFNARGTDWLNMVHSVMGFEPNRVVWDVTDKSKYSYDKGSFDEWLSKHAMCYESLNPDTGQTDQEVYRQVVKDMNDLLGLDVHLEKRNLKTLVLIRTSQQDLLKTKNAGIDPSYNRYQEGDAFKFRDAGIDVFTNVFNQHPDNPYVTDGTGYKDKIDMDLNIKSWTDLPAIKKELSRYGLGFKEELRTIEVLVFAETGGGYRQPTK